MTMMASHRSLSMGNSSWNTDLPDTTSMSYTSPVTTSNDQSHQNHANMSSNHYSQSPVSAASRQLPSPITSNLSGACMSPTWKGFIHTTRDGLIILESCLQGQLSHIPRRPHDRERQSIISSGNIFVYEENASGIRRWTDGITWSPSRIMGNFLVYRELLDGHPPGEKKRAAKKRKRGSEDLTAIQDTNPKTEEDRSLIGSLSLESYNFKPGGLAKKTLSVDVRGIRHHIISYYRIEDVKDGLYHRPTEDEILSKCIPRQELVDNPSFKSPVEDQDDKVNAILPAISQAPPQNHLHNVHSGVPVVLNVAGNSPTAQYSSNLPRGLPQHSSPAMMYQQRSHIPTYQLPVGPLDPFDMDHMSHYQPAPMSEPSRHRHHSISHSHHPPDRKTQPVPKTIILPPDVGLREEKRLRHDSHTHIPVTSAHQQQQLMYFDSPLTTGVDLGISNLQPVAPPKYVEDSYHHNLQQQVDFPHGAIYMLPQGQSYR
ncbi:hypothetical protein BT63DRAFT_257267 [Microthyrium microscopicum]|uniref:Camp independent regulatory protein n=1 Tax=Microthyrium microscopicum TaxID=703497 RepID=A0A6A6UEJ2_9PEZI|nr:hypothetical protein BT63DRAFT_257267 [Microthyrium microscopicum]